LEGTRGEGVYIIVQHAGHIPNFGSAKYERDVVAMSPGLYIIVQHAGHIPNSLYLAQMYPLNLERTCYFEVL
jgi:hypothetical protein